MLNCDRIDVSKVIDTNKKNGWHKCIVFLYWCFFRVDFRFYQKVCDGCHNTTQKFMNFLDFAIATVEGNDYRIHFTFMSKDEKPSRANNANLSEKSGQL